MADPYTTPIPGSSSYETATLAAKTAYDSALARLNQQRGDTLRQYGYSSSIDPTNGTVSNVQVDANLPYGQFQQERKSHADQYQSTRDAAQSRGLGHGGLAGSMVTNLRGGFGAEDAALGGGLTSQIGNFQDQQNQAAYSRDSALYKAEQQKTQDAITAQAFNQAQIDAAAQAERDRQAAAAQAAQSALIQQLLDGTGSGNDATNTPPPSGNPVGSTLPPPVDSTDWASIFAMLLGGDGSGNNAPTDPAGIVPPGVTMPPIISPQGAADLANWVPPTFSAPAPSPKKSAPAPAPKKDAPAPKKTTGTSKKAN